MNMQSCEIRRVLVYCLPANLGDHTCMMEFSYKYYKELVGDFGFSFA